MPEKLPLLGGTGIGKGVHSGASAVRERDIAGAGGAAGSGLHASAMERNKGGVYAWMERLSERLRRVRVCCGNWNRVLGPAATTCIGVTGVLLDPPYADTAGRDPSLYAVDSVTVAHEVREWALANGDDPKLRIVLCGLEGEHEMPPTWRCIPWKAQGGYGRNGNRHRERLWLSPHCLPVEPAQSSLFPPARTA